jgi:hypothetical protein
VKEAKMDITWRTVQLFLEDYGVAEVEVDQDNANKVRCTCPTFQKTAKCKHAKHIKQQMSQNDGHYSIYIPVNVDEHEAFQAMKSPELFREFVIKYGKVQVLD